MPNQCQNLGCTNTINHIAIYERYQALIDSIDSDVLQELTPYEDTIYHQMYCLDCFKKFDKVYNNPQYPDHNSCETW